MRHTRILESEMPKSDDTSADLFNELDKKVRGRRSESEDQEVDELRRRNSFYERLLAVTAALNSTLKLEEVLVKIVDAVVEITGCSRGYLMLSDEEGLALALARGADGRVLHEKSFDRSLSVIRIAAETGETQFVINAQEQDDLREQSSILDLDIKTVVCIPLEYQETLVGVIYADNDTIASGLRAQDVSILNAFGSQAAIAIENARQHGEIKRIRDSLETQNLGLRHELADRYEFSGIIGRSEPMRRVFDVIEKVAALSTTVLIHGETGTGKELIAKAIHYNSPRRERPIVSINCGALPRDLLESELFGYRRGAFTGADQDRAGLFEAAQGGTLFLDEIGEMPVELQVKLLRALQEGEVRRLGDDRSIAVDVRVIAATNRDLKVEVERGTFRNDLYYRLNVVPIQLPALRDRPEDILPLAEFFLKRFAERMDREKPLITRNAKELLLRHSWQGNVRELENTIERAMALGEVKRSLDVDQFEHLAAGRPVPQAAASGAGKLKDWMQAVEKEYIRGMLIRNSWNVSKTATSLGISRQQLHNKIKRLELTQPPV
jgi:Nif-specific regulatory protein